MGKTYKGCFAAVFIFLDFLVLLLSYRITQAPGLYYIFTGIILLSTIFYIIYKLYPHFLHFPDTICDLLFFNHHLREKVLKDFFILFSFQSHLLGCILADPHSVPYSSA